jgi:flagellar export protein FliJ
MAFRFSLRPVLRLRASYERLERLRLHALLALIVRVREEITAIEMESAKARRSVQERLGVGIAGTELHFETESEKTRAERKRRLEVRLIELQKSREKQQLAYQVALQKLKILENFRQRKWNEYTRELARREQNRLDELHLLHRGASKPPE